MEETGERRGWGREMKAWEGEGEGQRRCEKERRWRGEGVGEEV